MTVRPLTDAPPPDLARALAAFEEQFTYPLGPGRSFRIAHGDDYARFFRAMGEGVCFVAEREGVVAGTIGVALRRLVGPDGNERPVVYLGDLKIAPAARGGRLLLRLAQAVRAWGEPRADAAFSVVMGGTRVTPERYTGAVGLPAFRALGEVAVLRLSTAAVAAGPDEVSTVMEGQGEACYLRLSAGRYACPGGRPGERSETEPTWLVGPGGTACGRLEDTRRAKRLIADDGTEMVSAHLSCFAWADPRAGAAFLRAAARRAALRGFPALFVAVAAPDAAALRAGLAGVETVSAPATVFGTGLEPWPLWNVNTAEI